MSQTSSTPIQAGRGRCLRRLLLAALVAILLVVALEGWRVLLGSNFHEVLPGKVYRSAQPTPDELHEVIATYGIRTVVNLRGCCSAFSWYLDECRVTHKNDVAQEDICLSAGRLPSVSELRRFALVLDHAEYPLLLHCRRGADRTGLAAAVVLLWHEEIDVDTACRQLGLRYGHVPIGRPAHLDGFFALYTDWLKAHEKAHSKGTFRHWIRHEYGAGPYRASLEWWDPLPSNVPRGQPFALRVRARNLGVKAWRFRPGNFAGVHICLYVWDETDRRVFEEKSGLRDAVVHPGEAIELTMSVPPLEKSGRYRLLVDLTDEQHGLFLQMGSEPLEAEIVVRE